MQYKQYIKPIVPTAPTQPTQPAGASTYTKNTTYAKDFTDALYNRAS